MTRKLIANSKVWKIKLSRQAPISFENISGNSKDTNVITKSSVLPKKSENDNHETKIYIKEGIVKESSPQVKVKYTKLF